MTGSSETRRKKQDVVKDLPLYRKKDKTSIEATDLWQPVEDNVFLKYCPDVRLQLYQTMADDTSGRPHEILAKKFSNVKIKQNNGRIFGEVDRAWWQDKRAHRTVNHEHSIF